MEQAPPPAMQSTCSLLGVHPAIATWWESLARTQTLDVPQLVKRNKFVFCKATSRNTKCWARAVSVGPAQTRPSSTGSAAQKLRGRGERGSLADRLPLTHPAE